MLPRYLQSPDQEVFQPGVVYRHTISEIIHGNEVLDFFFGYEIHITSWKLIIFIYGFWIQIPSLSDTDIMFLIIIKKNDRSQLKYVMLFSAVEIILVWRCVVEN